MKQKEDESLIKILEKDVYPKIKRKILPIILKCEFNMILNFLKDLKTIKTFFIREMHGLACTFMKNAYTKFDTNLEFYLIFPKNKNDYLELNDFTINNIESNNIYNNNYAYKCNLLYEDEWENHRKSLYRFVILNKDKQKNPKNISNIISDDKNSINENSNINPNNFIDVILSFYIDINDNSTILLNEFYYDLNENDFLRFYDITNTFFEKVKRFIGKNFKIYLCNESILINRSMIQIFNYIMSLKIFYNKRFIIKDIQKFKNEINIYIDIQDKSYPDSFYQTRCHILKLSKISSFVSIISLIDIKYFNLKKRFLTLKTAIIYTLKIIKKHIEKEIIET